MSDPVVELNSGYVRGVVVTHEEGFNYYAFKGIPYGEPPVGELRFKDPVPVKKWSGIIDCKNYAPMASQIDLFTKLSSTNEDCLHINVFTRSINETNLSNPVILVAHGGSLLFSSGDDTLYGPDHLIRKDIVFVTVNYRLGVFGFLNLENNLALGNQGMKDLVMALKWIQQNIRMFGGDPNNVTVYGAGAGGGVANFLALSPLTKGLMHKVISSSVTASTTWMHFSNPISRAIRLCSLMGKDLKNPKEIYEFLKAADCKKLIDAQEQLRVDLDEIPFGPGIDKESSNPFMPFDQDTAAEQGVHLPYMVGYCAREGLLLLIGKTRNEFLTMCDENFEKIFKYRTSDILKRYNLSEQQIKRLYFKNKALSGDEVEAYVDLCGEIYLQNGIHRFAQMQAKNSSSPTYMYVFAYDSPYSLIRSLGKNLPNGANILDELPYLFKMRALEKSKLGHLVKGTFEYELMEQMTDMWTNFARYGKPTIESSDLIPVQWKPLDDGTVFRYLNIDEDITMQSMLNLDLKFASAKDIKI